MSKRPVSEGGIMGVKSMTADGRPGAGRNIEIIPEIVVDVPG
jgi:hypothetical protein